MDDREATNAALRARRQERKVLGLCVYCGVRLPEDWHRTRCPECTEGIRKSNAKYFRTKKGRAARRRQIARRRLQRWESPQLREQDARDHRESYAELKSAGVCVRCHQRDAVAGKTCCEPCAEEQRAYSLRRWHEERERRAA